MKHRVQAAKLRFVVRFVAPVISMREALGGKAIRGTFSTLLAPRS